MFTLVFRIDFGGSLKSTVIMRLELEIFETSIASHSLLKCFHVCIRLYDDLTLTFSVLVVNRTSAQL